MRIKGARIAVRGGIISQYIHSLGILVHFMYLCIIRRASCSRASAVQKMGHA